MNLQQILQLIDARIAKAVAPLFARQYTQDNAVRMMTIDGGNTLATGQNGIKYVTSLTTAPSAYDPNVTSTFADGFGRATLYRDNVAQTGYVMVINSSSYGHAAFALINGDYFQACGPIPITVGAGPDTIMCYTAG